MGENFGEPLPRAGNFGRSRPPVRYPAPVADQHSHLASFPYKIAVLCELRDHLGRILLLKRARDPNRGMYSPIGGKLDTALGESPAQCASREIMEEAGVEIPVSRLRLVGMISERGYENQTNWLLFWYRALDPVSFESRMIDEGELVWHHPGEIDGLLLPETDRAIIWPLVRQHEDGYFAVHIDCSGPTMRWSVEQSTIA